MIAIIDYGMGNIHSVQKALEFAGARTIVTNSLARIRECQKLVLPGVGAFGDAMTALEKQDLAAAIREHLTFKKPFLGICLGMQLIFEKSQESPGVKGLGILAGEVKKFTARKKLKVPHMGWNQLRKVGKDCPLLKGVGDNAFVYFCHSYYPQPADQGVVWAATDYGGDFASLVWKDSVFGVQFHPEKSQRIGLQMIKNFVEM